MKKNTQPIIRTKFEGNLAEELVRRASKDGEPNDFGYWLREYLRKLWRIKE